MDICKNFHIELDINGNGSQVNLDIQSNNPLAHGDISISWRQG